MNEIQIFNSPEFGEVRTVMIENEPWFVGKDIASSLGYVKERGAIESHVDSDDALKWGVTDSLGRKQETIVINESGLYSLIFGSKLETAKKFKRWVTSEVLPQLRKTGGYQVPTTTADQIKLLAQGTMELTERVDTLDGRMDRFEKELPILPFEEWKITSAARKRGCQILGGKKAKAYRNVSIRQKVFRNMYLNLNYNFGTHSYKQIRRIYCDDAVKILQEWCPPKYLAEEIEVANA